MKSTHDLEVAIAVMTQITKLIELGIIEKSTPIAEIATTINSKLTQKDIELEILQEQSDMYFQNWVNSETRTIENLKWKASQNAE